MGRRALSAPPPDELTRRELSPRAVNGRTILGQARARAPRVPVDPTPPPNTVSDTEPTAEHVLTTLDRRLVADLCTVDVPVTDVDGVLTDGSIVLDAQGGETMRFHVRDGSGIWMLSRAGVRVALLGREPAC